MRTNGAAPSLTTHQAHAQTPPTAPSPESSTPNLKPKRTSLNARERITLLTDAGTFQELGALRTEPGLASTGDGVVTGMAHIHGQQVFIYAQDFSVRGGSIGRIHAQKIVHTINLAARCGAPVIGLFDGGGARIQEGVAALDGCGQIFRAIVNASGRIPQISVILGPCAGAAAYAPALTDFVAIVRDLGMMYVTGPQVIEQVSGQRIDGQTLGGATPHATQTGVAHLAYNTETECLADIRYLVSLLPPSDAHDHIPLDTGDDQPRTCPTLTNIVPTNPRLPYNMELVIDEILDNGTFLEIHAEWGTSIICGYGRLSGRTVAIVANQPLNRAGAIDIAAATKAARFVHTSDSFNIPLISLVDVPGFMPGIDEEHGGILRHGAQLLRAYCDATVPQIQVIVRKAYGGAYIVMGSQSLGADLTLAWPTNEVAVMGPESAVQIIHHRKLTTATPAERTQLEDAFRNDHLQPHIPARDGYIDALIDPAQTRNTLITALNAIPARPRHRTHPEQQ